MSSFAVVDAVVAEHKGQVDLVDRIQQLEGVQLYHDSGSEQRQLVLPRKDYLLVVGVVDASESWRLEGPMN